MPCATCGHQLLPNARFCTRCGTPVAPRAVETPVAHALEAPAPTASGVAAEAAPRIPAFVGGPAPQVPAFAGGEPHPAAGVAPSAGPSDVALVDDYLVWNLHPGQVARLLAPLDHASLAGARGVAIHEGTRAVVFANGSAIADLQNGFFEFDRRNGDPGDGAGADASRRGIFALVAAGTALASRMLGGAATPVPAGAPAQPASGKPPRITVLLLRQGPLPLLVTLREVATTSVRTTVAVQFMIEITDPLAFHRALMQVRDEIGLNALGTALTPIIESRVRAVLADVTAEGIAPTPALEQRLAEAITGALGDDWRFIRVVRVAKVNAYRDELARLNGIKEATWFSERALDQAHARNAFANRLRLERNRQRLQEAADHHHLRAELEMINRDDLLGADDLDRFELLLDNGKRIREARSEDEYQSALAGLRRSELVREDALGLVAREAAERHQDHAGRRSHALALFDLSRQLETDQARLHWDAEIGDRRLDLELDRRLRGYLARYEAAALDQQEQRLKDEYADERQLKDAQHSDRRRYADAALDHRARIAQLDIARQAQALTEAKRRDDHQRELATSAQLARHEREATQVAAQRWSGMTVEQILAANPELSAAGATSLAMKYQSEAMALAEKAKAEAAAIAGDHRAHAAESSRDELREFMASQLATMQDLMRHTLEANARIAGAFAGGGQASGGRQAPPPAASSVVTAAYCSHCGKPLTGGACPTCPPVRP